MVIQIDWSKEGEWQILLEGVTEGVPWLILRGPFALLAYIGVPPYSKWAGQSYDDVPISVHGGLTFGEWGDGEARPKGLFWYGWDYGHYGDKLHIPFSSILETGHDWTVEEVEKDTIDAAKQMAKLLMEEKLLIKGGGDD